MYYTNVHTMVRKAAAAQGITIEDLITSHGISRATYYRHLKYGTPWKLKDVKTLSDITGRAPSEILDCIL